MQTGREEEKRGGSPVSSRGSRGFRLFRRRVDASARCEGNAIQYSLPKNRRTARSTMQPSYILHAFKTPTPRTIIRGHWNTTKEETPATFDQHRAKALPHPLSMLLAHHYCHRHHHHHHQHHHQHPRRNLDPRAQSIPSPWTTVPPESDAQTPARARNMVRTHPRTKQQATKLSRFLFSSC